MFGEAQEKLGKEPSIYTKADTSSAKNGMVVHAYEKVKFKAILPDAMHPSDPNYEFLELVNSSGGTIGFVHSKYPRTAASPDRFNIISMPSTPPPSQGYNVTVVVTDDLGGYGEATITVLPK